MTIERAQAASGMVRVLWTDGYETAFHAIWLRDNCLCPECRHPKTHQRLFEASSIPDDITAIETTWDRGSVTITWSEGRHRSTYEGEWLRAHAYDEASRTARRAEPERWGRGFTPVTVAYDALDEPAARRRLLEAFAAQGLVRVDRAPLARGTVAGVARRFGEVRVTNYGEVFDVESVPSATHLAYTGVALALHTDNPYRDPVPGVQLLHCLEASASGGESVFVDGFHVADVLRREAPVAYEILTRTPVPFRYRDATCDLARELPLLSVDADGAVVAVRYNDRSMAPLDRPTSEVLPFYEAYRAWSAISKRDECAVRFRMEPGDLVIFRNDRVLHGRSAFTGDHGRRLLQGCYADVDGFASALRVLPPI
jgi:gamma-butyrobetaine dioxygenase